MKKVFTVIGLLFLLVLGSGCASTKGRIDSTIFKQGAYRKVGEGTFECVLYRYEPNDNWFFIFEATDTWSNEKVLFTVKRNNESYVLCNFSHVVQAASGIWIYWLMDWDFVCRLESQCLEGRIEGRVHCERWGKTHSQPFLLEFSLPESDAEYERLKDLQEHDPG